MDAASVGERNPFALIFFMDGVGLGSPDETVNPFARATLPALEALLGSDWWRSDAPIIGTRASLVPTDATLGLPGRPQSATGQATILTGRNVPALVGEHYGPKPNPAVIDIIRQGTLFSEVTAAGGSAALVTPYPQGYFDAVARGKRMLSAVPLAAVSAGLALMTADDLQAGRAVSPDFTAAGWRDHLGYDEVPLLTPEQAGVQLATIAAAHRFSFFEHWPTDQTGHRGSIDEAVAHLELIDRALGGLFQAWDDERGLLVITSDHGNLEEKDHRQHTRNPVPTILLGRDHARYARQIVSLVDIAAAIRSHLALPRPTD